MGTAPTIIVSNHQYVQHSYTKELILIAFSLSPALRIAVIVCIATAFPCVNGRKNNVALRKVTSQNGGLYWGNPVVIKPLQPKGNGHATKSY